MQRTCGHLFSEMMARYTTDAETLKTFATGFFVGQCEKVSTGACYAAMFRPGIDWYDWACDLVQEIADAYGLVVRVWAYGDVREIWVCRSVSWAIVLEGIPIQFAPNSREWHRVRAALCGLQSNEEEPPHAP